MNDSTAGAPLPPPPPSPGSRSAAPPDRPRWGIIDTWPAVVFVILTVLTMLTPSTSETSTGTTTTITGAALFFAALIQQIIQGGWPWVVSRWKGLGMASDWKFRFEWRSDIGIGLGIAVICIIATQIVTRVVAAIIGLEATEDASNTSIVTDNQDSPWIIGVILLVVIGAPLTEELLFRGLVFRAFEKYLGVYVAVVISTVFFTIPHFQTNATWRETTVLFAGIGTIGLILALATVRYTRLGPAIVGHAFFNAFGVMAALLAA